MLKRVLQRITAAGLALLMPWSASGLGMQQATAASSTVYEVEIDAGVRYQTIENFGASDAWSMDPIGKLWSEENKTRVADLLFSVDEGIGLSAWRFNIGAGSAETDQEIIWNPWRRAESFKQTEDGPYDWSKQAGQQWFLQAAHDRGVETLIAFVNSPPVWMTKNGHAQPDASVGSTNLKAEYVEDFAVFLADVLEHFRDAKGIEFDYISPINEPTWDWNRAGQEGNRYNNEDLLRVIDALYEELSGREIAAKISAPDGVEILALLDDEYVRQFLASYGAGGTRYNGGANGLGVGKYREYIKDLLGDPETAAKIDHKIASHSYWSDYVRGSEDRLGYLRELLWKNLQDIENPLVRYWVTEYCILGGNGDLDGNGRDLGIDPALMMARTIHYDLTKANASAWQWWTAVSKEDYKDGLVYTDYRLPGDEETIYESKLLWGLGNFSRYIRPGAVRVSLQGLPDHDPYGLMGSAYLHEADKKLTSVYVNYSHEAKDVALRIKNLPDGQMLYHLIPHLTSAAADLEEQPMIVPDAEGVYTLTIPARSIMTLQGDLHPGEEVPAPPKIKSVTAYHTAAKVEYHHVPGAVSYRVDYGTIPGLVEHQGEVVSGTSYTLEGLTNDVTYYVRVVARNDYGESMASEEVAVVPSLRAPAALELSGFDGGFELSFASDPYVAEYEVIWQAIGEEPADIKKIPGEGRSAITHVVEGLRNRTSYEVFVTAIDGESRSAPSRSYAVTPQIAAPDKVIIVPGDGQLHVEFEPVDGAISYVIDMKKDDMPYQTLDLSDHQVTITGLTNGEAYELQIASSGRGGRGASGAALTAIPREEVLIWEDSFENGSSLVRYDQAISTWDIADGMLQHRSGGNHRGEIIASGAAIIDGVVTAIAKHSHVEADWGVVFRGTDADHAYGFGFENDHLYIRKDGQNLAPLKPFHAKVGHIYDMQVILDGNRIQAYLDGALIYDVEDSTYTSGIIGLHSWADAHFAYLKASRETSAMKAPKLLEIKPSDGRVQLIYTEVDGAEHYRVKYGSESGNYAHEVLVDPGSAVIDGLTNDRLYYFVVEAVQGELTMTSNELSAAPRGSSHPHIMYYVDAGDGSVSELEDGEVFGVYHGVEDQPYGPDPLTGVHWGYIADEGKTWAKTDETDPYLSIRQYDGDQDGLGLTYQFSLPNGSYNVSIGFDDPWDDHGRKMDIVINGELYEEGYNIGTKREVKRFEAVPVTSGELAVKIVKRSPSRPMLSWIKIEKDLLYYVDAGDASVEVLEEGEEFGLRNSREEQPYGADPQTGYRWGYVADDGQTWAQESDDRWDSIRQYDGNTNGKGLAYRFEVPNGTYAVELGFDDPWDDGGRKLKVLAGGVEVMSDYVTGAERDIKRIVGIEVTHGELEIKLVKDANSKPMISWLAVYVDHGQTFVPEIKEVRPGDGKLILHFDETIDAGGGSKLMYLLEYGTVSGAYTESIELPAHLSQYTIEDLHNQVPIYLTMRMVRDGTAGARTAEWRVAPEGPADPDLYYFVDAGALTLQEGVILGTLNSVPDQEFRSDPLTGSAWGYVADDGLTWAKSDVSDPYLSVRQYDGEEDGKGLAYHFTVPNGKYQVQLGFDDPWDHEGRVMDIVVEGETVYERYLIGDKREVQTFITEVKDELLEVKVVKRGRDKPLLGWISVKYMGLLDDEQPTDPEEPPEEDTTPPGEVRDAAVTSGDGKLLITWSDPEDEDLAAIVIVGEGETVHEAVYVGKGIERYEATGLVNGVMYEFRIAAVDTSGNKSAGTVVSGSPQADESPHPTDPEEPPEEDTTPPGEVRDAAVTSGDGKLLITWSDPEDEDLAAIVIVGEGETVHEAVYVGKGIERYEATGLVNGVMYEFRIAAVDTSGNRSAGTVVSGMPQAPRSIPPINSVVPTHEDPPVEVLEDGRIIHRAGEAADGKVAVRIGAEKLLEASTHAQDGVLNILIELSDEVDEVEVAVSLSDLLSLSEGEVHSISVDTGLAAVTISAAYLLDNIGDGEEFILKVARADRSQLSDDVLEQLGDAGIYAFMLEIGGRRVSEFDGQSDLLVSWDYELAPGEQPHQIIVYYIDENGALEIVKHGGYDAASGKVEFRPRHFSRYTAVHREVRFADVGAAWTSDVREAIGALAARGIVRGTADGMFAPEREVTRAEFVKMLIGALDVMDEQAAAAFHDVAPGSWYYDEVSVAEQLGIVLGRPDGSFGPDEKLTREQLAVMVMRALQRTGFELESGTEDVGQVSGVSPYAREAVEAMLRSGLMDGQGDDGFAPQALATRAEAAVVIYRLLLTLAGLK